MLTAIYIIVALALAIGLVFLIDKVIPSKFKFIISILLWAIIIFLGYKTYMSVYEPIKFNKVKEARYKDVIAKLKDIRSAQLAHKQVTGTFAPNFNDLVKFIDTAKYTITQRRDTTVIDKELTRRFGGVTMRKEIILVDTLGYVSVKDSLFKKSDRYKTMMNVPHAKDPSTTFELNAGTLEQNDLKIPVFEVLVKKDVLLHDQNKDLLIQENQTQSVDGVNGDALKVGSMTEVNTNGNWPKIYGNND